MLLLTTTQSKPRMHSLFLGFRSSMRCFVQPFAGSLVVVVVVPRLSSYRPTDRPTKQRTHSPGTDRKPVEGLLLC